MQHIDQRTKHRSDDDCIDLLLSECVTSSPLRYKREHMGESVDVGDPVLDLRGLGEVGGDGVVVDGAEEFVDVHGAEGGEGVGGGLSGELGVHVRRR
ncbi:protein NRT1/ PTR FAMILY 5.2-like [Iris pallida]|uniref:Protein NRT1/ PTR FAMILY 5.2-like n=1 Tax=Iris pallida TaxID=29817 RepID=A0AAX6FH42_IRIPA|nr:protein NRT1/ PTR FAMILY 5.2-like [Iris pallida]